MSPEDIRAAVTADATLLALAHARDWPALAAAPLFAGHTVIVSRPIGEGAVTLALGVPAGPVFVRSLRLRAETALVSTEPADIAEQAVIEQAWRMLCRSDLDVGLELVRSAIDDMVGVLDLSAEQATLIKALAAEPAPITQHEILVALVDAAGELLV